MGLVKLIVKFIYIEQPLCKRQVIFNGNDRQKNQKAEGKFVTFKQGDSLIGLCAKEYKNSGYAPMIASINNLISFRDIKP